MKHLNWKDFFFDLLLMLVIIGIVSVPFWIACQRQKQNEVKYGPGCIEITLYDKNYVITEEERTMLAKLVYLEAGRCGEECQYAVISAVLNRLESGYWGDTIEEVIFYPNAFSPTYLMSECFPPQVSYEMVDYVLTNGPTIPKEVRYFRADYDHNWEGYVHYATYDNVYFGFFTERALSAIKRLEWHRPKADRACAEPSAGRRERKWIE